MKSKDIQMAYKALKAFADMFGPLDNVGGGTLVAPEIKIQLFKDAQEAVKGFPQDMFNRWQKSLADKQLPPDIMAPNGGGNLVSPSLSPYPPSID